MNEIDFKTVDKFYFSRMIDSLEKDLEEWEMRSHSSFIGCYTEYVSPEYKNEKGKRIQFVLGDIHYGAYVNGYFSWVMKPLIIYNLFSFRTRRFWSAYLNMKSTMKEKERKKKAEFLMDHL